MDPTTLTIGGLAAGLACFYAGMRLERWLVSELDSAWANLFCEQTEVMEQIEKTRDRAIGLLNNLRSNAFITNERGHRVRYVNASQEARAKAEGN